LHEIKRKSCVRIHVTALVIVVHFEPSREWLTAWRFNGGAQRRSL
jgi:hypothetical protein